MRELRVEDALMYLDQVKIEFGDRPHIYNEFLDIMKTFKSQAIDTPGVIRRVASLFHGNKRLVLGFNTFLPEGYRIELPMDGSSWPVYREPGRSGVIAIAPPPGGIPTPVHLRPNPGESQPPRQQPPQGNNMGRGGMAGQPPGARMGGQGQPMGQQQQRGGMQQGPPPHQGMARGPPPPIRPNQGGGNAGPANFSSMQQQQTGGMGRGSPQPGTLRPAPPGPIPGGPPPGSSASSSAPSGGLLKAPPPQQGQVQLADSSKQPVEFDHAINYVTTIKKRFAAHPEIYRKFLEILHTYQKEQRGIKEVLDEVSLLFADHADLLKEFTYFLPDAVQSQAKAQLDVAAKKAEDRARARELEAKRQQEAKLAAANEAHMTAQGFGPPEGQQRGNMVLPPPPTPSGSRHGGQNTQPKSTRVPSHVPQVPFGATKGRSEDREREIARGAVHGVVSFDPARPPRRHELNATQAAQLLGRPTNIPPSPLQPSTSEVAFFEHVKAHFLRRDLFPDKPIVNRKQTPYMEFIKCLHLFGAGILNKDQLIQLLRGLFIQGNTPKSGANAPNTQGNLAATHASMGLLSELEKVLVGRGPFAIQEKTKQFKGKYGAYPIREYDLGDASTKTTPSYQTYPKDYLFLPATGEDESKTGEVSVLNYECFSIAQDWSTEDKGEKYFKSPESYDGIKSRCNVYEEVMARVEDEMHEVDMAIECNASVMRILEPVAQEATLLREQEEKDGQPIGRLQYKLRHRALSSIHIGAIARIYGESGEEVLQHLLRNPLVVVPIVFKRLQEKNKEWRQVKRDMNKEWRKIISENYKGSLDAKCFVYKREIELSFTADRLLEECNSAKSFAKHPSKILRHPATNMILPDFHLVNPNPELAIFQPHLSVLVSKNMPHESAAMLLSACVENNDKSSDKDFFQKVLNGIIKPWFGLESSSDSTSKFTDLTVGQRVRTSVDDGQIISVGQGNNTRYLVKFSFGVGYVLPSAIEQTLPSSNSTSDMDISSASSQLLSDDIQVLFGTEKMYLFMRLYILLVTMLYQAKGIADKTGYYSKVVSSIQDLLQGKIDAKVFEEGCRNNVSTDFYNFFAIPPLVEKCADALIKMAKEDCAESLFQISQLKLKDLNQQRNLSFDVTEDASYRIQIQSSASQVFFSYMPVDVELELTNPLAEPVGDPEDMVLEAKVTESSAAAVKRPLETGEEKAASNNDMVVEPEEKRMKTDSELAGAQEDKTEDKQAEEPKI